MLQLEETKQEIINNANLMKDNIKNYHQKIIEFIKFFTISLYEFILWFKNNEWDREKYKLNNTINNILQPGLIIKIEYKNDNLQYKLPWSNFIYLKTENDNYLVLAVLDSEEANFQILNKEGRKILIKKLIEEEKYYFLSRKFCNLYTKFTLVEDNFLSEKEVSKIFKKIEVLENIKTIENETPQLINNKQKEFFQAKLNEIFQKIKEEYQSLITSLKEIFPVERLKVINSSKTIDNNESVGTKNEGSLLFEMIIKYIDTYIENLIPKIKEKVEKEWEETEDEDWDAVEAITTAFKSEFEKKILKLNI